MSTFGYDLSTNMLDDFLDIQDSPDENDKKLEIFLNDLNHVVFEDQTNEATVQIRFQEKTLYKKLKSMYSSSSKYQFKMNLIYLLGYLEEFEYQCRFYFGHQKDAKFSNSNEYYKMILPYFQIEIDNSIFQNKMGANKDTPEIMKQLGFNLVKNDRQNPICYQIDKQKKTYDSMIEKIVMIRRLCNTPF